MRRLAYQPVLATPTTKLISNVIIWAGFELRGCTDLQQPAPVHKIVKLANAAGNALTFQRAINNAFAYHRRFRSSVARAESTEWDPCSWARLGVRRELRGMDAGS